MTGTRPDDDARSVRHPPTVRRIGVPDLTTTVLTMTLTGLAADSRPAGGTGTGTTRRLAAVTWLVYVPRAPSGRTDEPRS
jgi:hypothetical protein